MRWEVIEETPVFKVGDIVQLNHTTRRMVVRGQLATGYVECAWRDSHGSYHVDYYKPQKIRVV